MADTAAPAFDINDLTIGDLCDLEEAGVNVAEVFSGDKPALQMKAVAFIAKRREDPTFAWADAGALRLDFLGDLAPAA